MWKSIFIFWKKVHYCPLCNCLSYISDYRVPFGPIKMHMVAKQLSGKVSGHLDQPKGVFNSVWQFKNILRISAWPCQKHGISTDSPYLPYGAPNTQPYEIPNISVDNPCQDLSSSMIVLSKLEKLEKNVFTSESLAFLSCSVFWTDRYFELFSNT